METEESDRDILGQILSETELTQIPEDIATKLRSHFNENFEGFITAKAVFQHGKQNYEKKIEKLEKDCQEQQLDFDECKGKLEMAETHVTDLQVKLDEAKTEIYKLQESLKRLQKETSEFRRQRDAAVDERDTLQLQAERRDHEVERLHTELNSLSAQLQSAVAAKCQALAESEEIKSRELNLDYKEKRLEQERNLMCQQMSSLEVELSKKTSELQTTRSEASARSLLTETRLSQLEEELRISNDSLTQLREVNTNFQKRCDELTQKLEEQRNHELAMHSSYREEIGAQTRLADLYKGMSEEANAKAEEYTNAVKELQSIVEQATDQYGTLETAFAQFKLEHEEILAEKERRIEELSAELEKANELLGNLKQERLDQAVEQLAPTAAITSRILKKGLSLTQIYTKLVDTVNELTVEKEENDKLKAQMDVILKELEDKAPAVQRQRVEYEAAVANVETLSNQLDELLTENNRLQETADEAARLSSHQTRENQRLKTELSDLARQVCFLLKEVQESRTGTRLPTGDETAMETDLASSQLISKRLVTFRDIEELQENNQKLLSIVRTLSTRQEEIERSNDDLQSGELNEKLARYLEQLSEMQAAQERQSKMLDGLMRQRDMYKSMYQQALNQTPGQGVKDSQESLQQDSSSEDKSTSEDPEKSLQAQVDTIKELERKLSDAEIKLKAISDEYSTYKKEKAAHEKMLGEEVERLRKEADTNSTRCCRLKVQLDSSQERFNLLQSNVATYRSQIKALEETRANYSTTIGKHEQSIMLLKDEALTAQSKLSRAEVQLENLRQERQHLRDNEGRLLKEREMLHRERQTQALLKADVESIKASLERAQAEGQLRAEMRLDDANRECAALRRRLQEEQDRFRELSSHLERQLSTAQERLAEEQTLGERLKSELDEVKTAQGIVERKAEELEAKLRETQAQSRAKPITGDENLAKRLHELELQLAGANAEIRSLVEQLKTARQQNQQYSDIADSTETQLKEMADQHQKRVRELETALEAARNDAATLDKRVKHLESELMQSQSGQQVSDSELRERLSSAETKLEELDEVKGELELMKSDLQAASQAAHEAEEKYAREMVLHSNDLQALAKLRSETENISKTVSQLTQARDTAVAALEAGRSTSQAREGELKKDIEELERRIDDLDKQNGLLHNQIQELSDRTAIMQSSRSSIGEQEAMDTSIENMNKSFTGTEEDSKSTEQLLKIIKYLRREKDLAVTKLDVLRAESMRLKSQVENLEKRVKDAEEAMNSQREKSDIDVATTSRHAELLRKVETLNAIADSNRILREERDTLLTKVTDLSSQISTLSEEVVPLREQARDLTAKTELLTAENTGLRSEAMRWRQRANALVERANKASPEDWRRLQTERENLSKLLTSEREIHAKKMEELNALKAEKARLEEQNLQLQKQIQTHGEEATKASEEARKLGQDLNEALADSTSKSNDLASLKKELDDKEAALNDVKNKEIQIRRIAKKYKTQYEELANRRVEEVPAEPNPEDVQATQEKEEVLREEGRREIRQKIVDLEGQIEELNATINSLREEGDGLRREIDNLNRTSSEKEERTTRLLKTAKTRIMQLTESKARCERELIESKEKIESMSNDNDQSEHDARLTVIKSQLEARIARLEHEKAEIIAEKEALLQRIAQMQRQLSAGVSGVSVMTEPPTANIKPMASARAETPLASIRPLNVQSRTAAVMPTTANNPVLVAPQQQQQVVHTTETSSPTSSHTDYQPSTSTSVSQAGQSNLRQLAVQPQLSESAESTQREESENSDNGQQVQQQGQQQSCQNQQVQQQGQSQQVQGQDPQQPPQTVALVSPRVEQQSMQQTQQTTGGDQQQTIPSSSTQSVSTSQVSGGHKRPRTLEPTASGSGVVEGTDLRTDQPSPKAKRIRTQEMPSTATTSGSEVEYQVPTSSQRDQDEEPEDGCVVVDCDEGGGHNQAPEEEEFDNDPYGEMEEDEEEEEEEEEELPYGVEEEVEGDNNEVEIMEDDSRNVEVPRQVQQAIPTSQPQQQQSEAISSAGPTGEPPAFSRSSRGIAPMPRQQQHFLLPQQGYEDGGDDSIVPSTPTLFVPRRGDGFGEAVSSPQVPQGRFTFGDSTPSSTPSLTPTCTTVRTMFAVSGSGVAQVVQEGMDDTRMDLTQLEDGGTGRSVPTTPLQVSPAADLPPSTSGGQEEQEVAIAGSSATPGSVDMSVEGTSAPSIRVTDEQESEQMEAVPGSSTAPGADGVSSESDQPTTDPSGCGTEGSVDEDSVEAGGDEGDAEEEGREAEASPSSNVRQRNTVSAGVNAANIISGEENRGAVTRRSARAAAQQYRGNPRGARTPITWGNQGTTGQSPVRGHPARGTAIDGVRGRGSRGRRARSKYSFPRY
ncbi:nucleoprotein TPR [Fopius arisanus]|uniref:Nucleoprotein TPR n=2 Tax=Fopius arisanus TaxID=64838 RepID=A0A9R1TX70_9HYME|nr:PREDICTED: nucleoprotein TPR [Fopius arisanus]